MRRAPVSLIAMGACIFAAYTLSRASSNPSAPPGLLTMLSAEGRTRVDQGDPVIEVLPARGGDLAVFGAAQVQADGDRLVAWMHHVDRLQTGRYVPVSRRFSDPPKLEDLDALSLDDGDLDDLRRCRPGDCGLKLSAPEIAELRRVTAEAGARWKPAVQAAFRQLVLHRTIRYLAEGDAGTPPYHDHKQAVRADSEFATLAERMRLGTLVVPEVVDYLQRYPNVDHPEVESFLYWSKGALGTGKQIVTITHIAMLPNGDRGSGIAALVASKQVFANHYFTASLSLTAIVEESDLAPRYLVYTRRSRADMLNGPFGGLVRRLAERRIRAEAPGVLDGLRRRLESGEPSDGPDQSSRLD